MIAAVTTDEVPPGPVEPPFPEPPVAAEPIGPTTPVLVRPPTRVVWSLVAVNVVVFALELLWGGSDSALTLHRMGAGLGRAGLAHEPWRIVSAAFLHINIVHLALNMWALVVFGRMLEIILGARRFIVLYALSAAGGGLASSLFHVQILSAGASGAVWGLMTGQIAAIVRLKRQQGPERVPVRMSTLLQPLVVNLLFSLMPGIDLAAHLGGGVVGAGLILSGLIGWRRPEPAGWRPAAWGASLAMVGCLAVALAQGRPWELRWPPPLVPRVIAGTPFSLPVPGGLEPRPSREENGTVFGDLSLDPLAVSLAVGRLEAPVVGPQRPAYLSQLARDLAAVRPLDRGWSWDQPPRVVQLRVRPAVFSATRFPAGGRAQRWLIVEGSWWLKLDVLLRPDAPASWANLPLAIANGVSIHAETPSIGDRGRTDPQGQGRPR